VLKSIYVVAINKLKK